VDLAAIETGLGAWLGITARNINKDGDDIGPMPVEYGRRPKKVHTGPFVLAYLGPIGKLGWDFPRYTFNEITDELVEQMLGVRRMPVRFSFRAFNQDWGLNARQFAEDFRIRLKKDTAMAALGAARLALFDSTDLIETDYEYSGRLISQVDLTVVFGLCAFERNATDDVGYIKSVNIEGQGQVIDEWNKPVEDEEGNPVIVEDVMTINVTTE
jgi:hypothetical protein